MFDLCGLRDILVPYRSISEQILAVSIEPVMVGSNTRPNITTWIGLGCRSARV